MTARLSVAEREVNSNARRRSEVAAVLHHAFRGHAKMVAASRGERGVSASTIYKEAEGLCASPLEHVVGDLERLNREGASGRVEFVLRWLCDHFGYDVAVRAGNGPRSALDATLADIARESGQGVSDAIEALRNHVIDAEERPKLEAHAQKNIALWHAFLNEVKSAAQPQSNNVRAIRSA